jgi:DNA-binding NtrC family response regulator
MRDSKRILVVDDDERVLFVMHDILKKLDNGYEVVTAHSGREALDETREQSFDLVITDLKMPDIDGVELTERITALNTDGVVLWITAYGCHKVRDEAKRLGVYDCLEKPLGVAEIRQAVLEVLEGAEGQDPH